MPATSDPILAWLETIASSPSSLPSSPYSTIAATNGRPRSKKRKISHPLSPPRSTREHDLLYPMAAETPRGKRLRADDAMDDAVDDQDVVDEPTPRQGTRRSFRGRKPPSLASSRTGSQASGYSSPSKELSNLELNSDGIHVKVLRSGATGLPRSLSNLLLEIEDIGSKIGVVPGPLKPLVQSLSGTDESFRSFREFVFGSGTADHGSHGPKAWENVWDAVTEIVAESVDCQQQKQVESGWNNLVHTPVIKTALSYGRPLRRLRLAPCMAARIIRDYLPLAAPGKMVDYAICIDPLQDEARDVLSEAIDTLRRNQPLHTVNHTDFEALRNRPITFSIETKRRGEKQVGAETQISLWHAAQWKFLSSLVGERVSTLEYIPALIVIGDEWKFVASTYSNNKTVMWFDCALGSTNSELGTFQVMAGIRRLGKWAADVYWPWYKKEVLRV